MFTKVFFLVGLVAMCRAWPLDYGYGHGHAVSTQNIYRHDGPSHIVGHGYGHGHDEYAYPLYKFDYGVKDHHTGDNKQQWESRDGDVTKGGYSLAEHDRSIKREQVFVSGHHGINQGYNHY